MTNVYLPSFEENMTEARILRWIVSIGEHVIVGQNLAEVETDKATFEFTSEHAGTLSAILIDNNVTCFVGGILCILDGTEEDTRAAVKRNLEIAMTHAADPEASTRLVAEKVATTPKAGSVRATPAARRLARENGIELADVAHAFNVNSAIREEHVTAFLARGISHGR